MARKSFVIPIIDPDMKIAGGKLVLKDLLVALSGKNDRFALPGFTATMDEDLHELIMKAPASFLRFALLAFADAAIATIAGKKQGPFIGVDAWSEKQVQEIRNGDQDTYDHMVGGLLASVGEGAIDKLMDAILSMKQSNNEIDAMEKSDEGVEAGVDEAAELLRRFQK